MLMLPSAGLPDCLQGRAERRCVVRTSQTKPSLSHLKSASPSMAQLDQKNASKLKLRLTHFRMCPKSRSIRIVLSEIGIETELAQEQPWDYRPEFLSINPAGELPVLEVQAGPTLCGVYAISEYLAEELNRRPVDGRLLPLFPGNREDRAEVRRLVDWFHQKLDREVTSDLLHEKVYARLEKSSASATPDVEILRTARANLRYHMSYISYLAQGRRWLAGEDLSFADIAAAAQLSVIDYLGEVPWADYPFSKDWYARVKSRPSMRALLADKIAGVPPPAHYADLDF